MWDYQRMHSGEERPEHECSQARRPEHVHWLQDVLICGWGDSTFMVALLHSMDEELPKGSQVTVFNLRPKEEVLGGPSTACWPRLRPHGAPECHPAQGTATCPQHSYPHAIHWSLRAGQECVSASV